MERANYLGGGVGVQSPFDAIALQTVTLLAMQVMSKFLVMDEKCETLSI